MGFLSVGRRLQVGRDLEEKLLLCELARRRQLLVGGPAARRARRRRRRRLHLGRRDLCAGAHRAADTDGLDRVRVAQLVV